MNITYEIFKIFFAFIIYSIIGYIAEVLFCSVGKGKIYYQRGYLVGPWCPIYGTGALIMYSLAIYSSHPEVVFILGAFLCTVVEYLTSYLMELIFKTRWWDYSHQAFNINGRVTLRNSILFGLGALALVYFLKDFLSTIIGLIPVVPFIVINVVLLILFVVDVCISTNITNKFVKTSELLKKDMTKEIKDHINIELVKHYKLSSRLLNSFPNAFKTVRRNIKELNLNSIKESLIEEKEKIKTGTKKIKDKVIEKAKK